MNPEFHARRYGLEGFDFQHTLFGNTILLSPSTYAKFAGNHAFFYTVPGGSRRFKLDIRLDTYCKPGVGYIFYRGQYIKSVKL